MNFKRNVISQQTNHLSKEKNIKNELESHHIVIQINQPKYFS